MQAKLVIVKGQSSKGDVKVKVPSVIGRSRDASLTIAHPLISRQHCELFEMEGLLMIRDLGSLNGTYIGDDRVAEAPLPPQSRFTVGPLTFRVEYEYEGDLDALPAVKLAPSDAARDSAASAESDDSEKSDTTAFGVRSANGKAQGGAKQAAGAQEESDEISFTEVTDIDGKSDGNDAEEDTLFSLADEVETEPLKPLKAVPAATEDSAAESVAATPAPAKPEKKGWFGFGRKKANKGDEAAVQPAPEPVAEPEPKPTPAKKATAAKPVPAKPAAAKPAVSKPAAAKNVSADDLAFEALLEDDGKGGEDGEPLDDFFKSLE